MIKLSSIICLMKNLSKARTLEFLKTLNLPFIIPDLLYFTTHDFKSNPSLIILKINNYFSNKKIIIRSSALDEDRLDSSGAGKYDSVLNIDSNDLAAIKSAIQKVISSYGSENLLHEVIVQEMISDVSMSGVLFTHDLNVGSPYYVINYDDVSGLTDTVTSGYSEYSNRTLYVYRDAIHLLHSARFRTLLNAVKDLEDALNSNYLDIEFALSHDLKLYLFQARSISTRISWDEASLAAFDAGLTNVKNQVSKLMTPKQGVLGDKTILGQMPDWNPAEMIGRAPRKLSFSLYKKLITDGAWLDGRAKMGYSSPAERSLMVSLAGQPYIDTRLSFNSFLPKKLPLEIGEKLINYWVETLRLNPTQHDKIEFNIAITAYDFDLDSKLEKIDDLILGKDEKSIVKDIYKAHFKEYILDKNHSALLEPLKDIEILRMRCSLYSKDVQIGNIESLKAMIEDCVRYGTVPFAILARHGFISKLLLNSLITKGILSDQDATNILNDTPTVATELVRDIGQLKNQVISRDDFMLKYGHLRPGTYDIQSKCYDQSDDLFKGGGSFKISESHANPTLNEEQVNQINSLLNQEGFDNWQCNDLMNYIKESIVAREYSKFIFTKCVSQMLELLASFGKWNVVSRDQLAHIPIEAFLECPNKENPIFEKIICDLKMLAEINSIEYGISSAIRLPQLISEEDDVLIVPFQVNVPNFITTKKIISNSLFLSGEIMSLDIENKIILIESADPGYDWIFAHKIAGLVTKFGGANSHMAIRCAEFSIPAAIGCGEQRFDILLKSKKILIDCASGFIKGIE